MGLGAGCCSPEIIIEGEGNIREGTVTRWNNQWSTYQADTYHNRVVRNRDAFNEASNMTVL